MIIRIFAILVIGALAYLAFWQGKPAVDTFMATEISTLLRKANEFDGHPVTVTATVMNSAAIMGLGGYKLKQGEAEILVVTGHGIPAPGAQVTVSGTFRQAFAFGGLNYAVIIAK